MKPLSLPTENTTPSLLSVKTLIQPHQPRPYSLSLFVNVKSAAILSESFVSRGRLIAADVWMLFVVDRTAIVIANHGGGGGGSISARTAALRSACAPPFVDPNECSLFHAEPAPAEN
jgi:hypothetical protein